MFTEDYKLLLFQIIKLHNNIMYNIIENIAELVLYLNIKQNAKLIGVLQVKMTVYNATILAH